MAEVPIPFEDEVSALIKAFAGMLDRGGGLKDAIGEQAGVIADIYKARLGDLGALVIPRHKVEELKQRHPDAMRDVELAMEKDQIAVFLIPWLMQVQAKFDNPNK